MIGKLVRAWALAAPLLLGAAHSSALVIDTGPGTDSGGVLSAGPDNPLGAGFEQSLAVRFTLADATTIASVKGWMSNRGAVGDALTASIYTSNGYAPGARLYSASFQLGSSVPSWMGATGLDWSLAAGAYWVVFEGRAGQVGVASFAAGVPNPLDAYRWMAPSLGDYWSSLVPAYRWGVQISDVAAVPEPGSLLMLLAGLALVAVTLQRRRVPH